MTVPQDHFHQRVLGIAGFGFLSAVTAAMWMSPLVGFLISILVGIISIGLRVIHSNSPRHHLLTVRIYLIVSVIGFLIAFVGLFITHHPFFLVVFLGIQTAQWILLFFT